MEARLIKESLPSWSWVDEKNFD